MNKFQSRVHLAKWDTLCALYDKFCLILYKVWRSEKCLKSSHKTFWIILSPHCAPIFCLCEFLFIYPAAAERRRLYKAQFRSLSFFRFRSSSGLVGIKWLETGAENVIAKAPTFQTIISHSVCQTTNLDWSNRIRWNMRLNYWVWWRELRAHKLRVFHFSLWIDEFDIPQRDYISPSYYRINKRR